MEPHHLRDVERPASEALSESNAAPLMKDKEWPHRHRERRGQATVETSRYIHDGLSVNHRFIGIPRVAGVTELQRMELRVLPLSL